jgi:enoyl-CoA hydratase/carnithine racemase
MTNLQVVKGASWVELHLDRPEKKNALTSEMYADLAEAMVAADGNPDVRSIIIAGRGMGFCAGNDLADFLSSPLDDSSPVWFFLNAISTTPKVLIAAVQGPCVGIGATMLLHCDHVVASETAALQYNFTKMALVPEAASSLLLPRAVGHLKASELLLLGDVVPATEALRLGLVSRVVADGEQLAGAQTFASRIGALPPQAVRLTKQLIKSETDGVARRMGQENAIFKRCIASPEFKAAVGAFMESRAHRSSPKTTG